MAHPEVAAEQSYVDEAVHWREQTRANLERAPAAAANSGAARRLRESALNASEQLGAPDESVLFGRLDTNAEAIYVGRHAVFDGERNVLVVSWKAPVAERYYRATIDEPLGVRRRRVFELDGNTVLDLSDTFFDREAADLATPYPGMKDALLDDLVRHRTGAMQDIVRTIQSKQDEVLRRPKERTLVVQGGPGTGKTAIGLHRASYLLYTHSDLQMDGVLVVGPNRAFMRYIANVLPALGDQAAEQLPITGLAPQLPLRADESVSVRRLKGDPRMAELLKRAVLGYRQIPDEPEELTILNRRVWVEPRRLREWVAALRDRPHNLLRDELRQRLANHIASALRVVAGQVLAASEFDNLMERVWPRLTPQELLRDTFTVARRLQRAADGILSEEEASLLSRPAGGRLVDEPWTEADYPLLDEAQSLLNGAPETFGHVVVDEAQDLSPMQLRSIARRCAGTLTVLGDLAQATGPWAPSSWDEVIQFLPEGEGADVVELDLGYRVPAQAFRFAARLLPHIAPALAVPEPIRDGESEPTVLQVAEQRLLTRVVETARMYAGDGNSVGIIAMDSMCERVGRALSGVGVNWADGVREGPTAGITVLPAWSAKGLEFDTVIVVEPSMFAAEGDGGLRLLYVALTRCTRHLSIVHSLPLPSRLRDEPVSPMDKPAPSSVRSSPVSEDEGAPDDLPAEPGVAVTPQLVARLVEQVGAALLAEARRHLAPELMPLLIKYLRDAGQQE